MTMPRWPKHKCYDLTLERWHAQLTNREPLMYRYISYRSEAKAPCYILNLAFRRTRGQAEVSLLSATVDAIPE